MNTDKLAKFYSRLFFIIRPLICYSWMPFSIWH